SDSVVPREAVERWFAMRVFKALLLAIPALNLAGQVQPQVVGQPIRDGHVTTVFLAPRYTTAIRMPEPVNSVVVGDPASFSAEHSDREPTLVFVKPITAKEIGRASCRER